MGALLVLVLACEANSDRKNQQNYNARVEKFNNLPQSDRIAISKWSDYDVDEDYLLASEPEPRTFWEWLWVIAPYAGIVMAITLSTFLFWWYAESKPKRYFFADLPLRGIKRAICVLLLWLFWPVLLVSLIRMKRWEAEAIDKQQEELATSKIEEGDDEMGVMPQPEEGLVTDENGCVTYEDRSIDRTHFAEDSYAQFEKYCQLDTQEAYKKWLCETKTHICDTESELREAGEQVKALQKQLKKAKTDLEELKAGGPSTVKSLETIRADWEAIKKMRGVVDIYYDDYELKIAVEVRVPYSGEIYDFGDYIIAITNDNNITCYRKRSGVRSDWTDNYPDYCYDDGTFCLGDREYVIKKYLRQHRLREAVILTIDCLHSVNNDEDAEDIPNCFRKIVSPKEG